MRPDTARIDQLRIDRGAGRVRRGSHRAWVIAGVAIAIAAAGAAWALVVAHPAAVAVSAAAARALPSSGAPEVATALDASGYVVANRQATVSAKITGKLSEVLFQEGQHVKAGQVLAKLDDTNAVAQLGQAKAQVGLARTTIRAKQAQLDIAQRILARQRKLQGEGFLSREAVDNTAATSEAQQSEVQIALGQLAVSEATLAAAQRGVDDTIVRAPFSGVITVKAAQPGEIVSPVSAGGGFTRTGIGTIVDMDSLEVDVDVNESFINRVRAGQAATVTLNAYPDWRIPAEVIAVVPTADRTKATVGVRIAFKERDARILPQMGARVSFLAQAAPAGAAKPAPGVAIPAAAIRREGDRTSVFVVRGDTVEERAVRLGAVLAGGAQAVSAGLAAGDVVAVGDISRLRDGATIRLK